MIISLYPLYLSNSLSADLRYLLSTFALPLNFSVAFPPWTCPNAMGGGAAPSPTTPLQLWLIIISILFVFLLVFPLPFSSGLPAIYSLLLFLQFSLFFPAPPSRYLFYTITFAIFPILSHFNFHKIAMGWRAPL